MEQPPLSTLEHCLGYTFRDPTLIGKALRHSSFVNEQDTPDLQDNERLEFLGDAVLNLVVGHFLMLRYPGLNEGDLSRIRASLVNEFQLSQIARNLDLGAYLQLGKGEMQTNGREKNSILADALEAVIAAVYMDGGYQAAFKLLEIHFKPLIEALSPTVAPLDFKSRLQELLQFRRREVPVYFGVEESGPDHDKTFVVEIDALGLKAQGIGKSKKAAEQDAARHFLEVLDSTDT